MSKATSNTNRSIGLSQAECAVVLVAGVERLMRLGVEETVAISAVARDSRMTGECVRAAMRVASREVIA